MNAKGRSLELFFVDGDPNGLLTAEMFNWTGHVLKAPRTQIKDALSRAEAKYTGAYVLLGNENGRARAYIGESDNIAKRIGQHAKEKDWWTDVAIIASASNNLHKAHAAYLEMRLIQLASEAGRADLENSTAGSSISLPEAVTANMEAFLDNLLVVLPAIKIDIFEQRVRPSASERDPTSLREEALFEIHLKKEGVEATAVLEGGEFIVQAGSRAREEWVGSHKSYQRLREELLESKVLGILDGKTGFMKSYAFASPSAAAAIVLGRNSNGTTEWKHTKSGATFKDWEAKQLEETAE